MGDDHVLRVHRRAASVQEEVEPEPIRAPESSGQREQRRKKFVLMNVPHSGSIIGVFAGGDNCKYFQVARVLRGG